MKLDRVVRVAIGVVIALAFIVMTGALLFISESALNVWDRLRAGPAPLLYAYVAIMAFLDVELVAQSLFCVFANFANLELSNFVSKCLSGQRHEALRFGNRPNYVYRLWQSKKLLTPLATVMMILLAVPLVQRLSGSFCIAMTTTSSSSSDRSSR